MKPIFVITVASALLVALAGGAAVSMSVNQANPARVILYDERDYQGESILLTIQPGECINLSTVGWDRRAVSIIPTHSNCFRLFFDDACEGVSVHKDVFSDYNNDLHMNFMGRSARGIDFMDGRCFPDQQN